MTTPTQAQIEAAARALLQWDRVPIGLVKAKAEAALTAAAQVGETDHAAEASAYLRDKANKHEIAATIERCAQRLEQMGEMHTVAYYVAAIRKLKDSLHDR